ncbi:HAD-superfamily hydrolase, subfamily IIB [Halobacteroides halobius DSM 5150]|uniref:HAD-superfamily hydrolase, subfamily IIB n=1 Tax=Halobacteroides halobius (strain ATCC 35273 / DSM 5150 / MD-1) TaxID=748449 RepID=L0K9P4_HALHC|nr:Cof-type HAD-IIB family hydrolase [Halobacteroides halobius]AGB41736.1 HAD-superfamily hydrolase, subfamily IIB [Halobacteroides halobius DSM 5150]
MSYKLVAIDMDGTLLNNQHQVSIENKKTIKQLAKQGIGFVLASGRPYDALHPYTQELEVYLPLITANGSVIKSTIDNKVYHKWQMPLKLAQKIYHYGLRNNFAVSLYFEDEIVTFDEELAQGHRELEKIEPKVMEVEEFEFTKAPIKILYYNNSDEITKAFSKLTKQYADKLYITRSDDEFLEFLNADVSKGMALEYLIERLDLTAEEVIAIGNNHNDIAMFEVAGLAVAMDNAPQEVKEEADFITKSNLDNGVAYALKKFILNDKGEI